MAGIANPAGAGATALINESLDNTTTSPVNVIYVITPTINGCAGTPFNLTVTVNPTSVVTSAAAKTVCDVTRAGIYCNFINGRCFLCMDKGGSGRYCKSGRSRSRLP